ncbi:MAG: hypothetical protein JWN14_5138, partial [Chthonomonadales bacterium]|nr:hypothetical protein [Chthonomonadales bacterium]
MTPQRIRAFMKRYGNSGVLMVAVYLAARSLWRHRKLGIVGFCLVIPLLVSGLRFSIRRSAQQKTPPHRLAQADRDRSATTAAGKDTSELRSAQTLLIGHDTWTFEARMPSTDTIWELLRCFRNGQLVQTIDSHDMGKNDCGQYFEVRLMHFPTRFPIIAVRVQSGAGHGQVTRYYAVRHGQMFNMGEIEAECGGPVFRDLDGDGKPEWVFDDFDPRYGRDRPDYYKVYK